MNYEVMHDQLMQYCTHCSEETEHGCDICAVEELCSECYGNFRSRPDLLERAYARVYGIPTDDAVNHPSHYTQGNIECIDAMVSAFGKEQVATYCKIAAFKYIWRMELKNGMEDCEKAIWYLQKYKELMG